ncbi:hypothetical protein M1293_01205 [Candidatus Parvarchaeota archaeon]|nr:hypothetical protein [Candidatus Parvarchaeota archaeon]
MILEIFISALIAFVATLIGGQFIIPVLLQAKLLARDINKKNTPILPTSGGTILLLGLFFGVLSLVFASNYIVGTSVDSEVILISLMSILAITFIGFLDDLIGGRIRTFRGDVKAAIKRYKFFNGGIKQWQKPVLTLIAAIPLMVINLGSENIKFPLIGVISINPIVYTLVFIPLAVAFSANSFNMLEGMNGIASQMGLVAFIALSIFSYYTQNYTAFSLSVIFSAVLLAYVYFGSYPAKVLPGDSLTYLVGAGFAATVIIGKMQVLGLILIIPWIIEFFLKARARFHANSWGIIQKDGKLKSPNGGKIYSLTHVFMRSGKYTEMQIVSMLTVLEAAIAALGLLVLLY